MLIFRRASGRCRVARDAFRRNWTVQGGLFKTGGENSGARYEVLEEGGGD